MPQATPQARKIAKEVGIDLETVQGTGKSGYITLTDVETAMLATNGKDPGPDPGPPFSPELHEDFDGDVYPVSELYKMRFRQDDPVTGEFVGDDLLGIRPKAVGGRFRSHQGILGFYIADRGFFVEGVMFEPKDLPKDLPKPAEPDEPKQSPIDPVTPGASEFAVSE